jgi:hypothetical protein
MRQWNMRIERAEYECALAERRYEEVDPSNRLVAVSLERRWNEALSRFGAVKSDAAKFQTQKTRVLTAEQRAKILALACDLPHVWRAPTTQAKDRKRMLRLLIADITVENLAAERQVVLHICWQGGACSDVIVKRDQLIAERRRRRAETIERVRELSRNSTDLQIAEALNKQGLLNGNRKPFTLSTIKWIRYRHAVPAACLQRPDEITVKQLADELGVSIYFVHYWIKQGVINARQIDGHGSWWITLSDEQRRALNDRISNSGHFKNRDSDV